MIEDLKVCAEFLGKLFIIESGHIMFEDIEYIEGEPNPAHEVFNPHEESGRYWLVEILRKFDKEQWRRYENIILGEIARNVEVISGNRIRDILTAPSDICFKCVCEVLNVNKTPKS